MSHTEMDAANKPQIVHPTQWRWTDTAPYRIPEYGDTPTGGICAVYFPQYGSWYRVAHVAYVCPIDSSVGWYETVSPTQSDGSVGWYEYELQCTPPYTNGEPDTEQWGPVEEHGFDCMGMPEGHTHNPEADRWMAAINSALATTIQLDTLGIPFFLEDFE